MKLLQARMNFFPAFLFLFQTSVIAQADYSFKNAVLVSGTALQTGAKYKFSNVKTGVDAFVTIVAQTGGIRLTDIDNVSTGFDEAFQPLVNMGKNSAGYVEFRVDFADVINGLPKLQGSIPVTCIHVDGATFGDGILFEKDQVQFFPGNYDFSLTGGKLEVTIPEGWVAISNTSGTRNSTIDTVTKDVMATVVNKNISGFLLRVGGSNSSPTISEARQRSIYFKSFTYGRLTTLPNRTMLSLSGRRKQNHIELKGTLSANHSYNKMFIERAVSSNLFGSIDKIDIVSTGLSGFNFTYLDTRPENGVNYYRVRLVGTNTNIQEISNTLMVKMENSQMDLEIINTILQGSNPVFSINSSKDYDAELQVVDMSGRVVLKNSKTKLNRGFNSIILSDFHSAIGYFVLIVSTGNKTISQKIMVQ
jgi:hypothetical protein